MSLLRRPVLALASVAVIVVAVAVVTNALPLRQIVEQRQEVADARATLNRLSRENEVLSDQVTALHTPLEIERLAREKLGYVRPGEAAYVVMEERPAEGAVTETPATAPAEGDVAPLVSRIWDFITGRDLVEE